MVYTLINNERYLLQINPLCFALFLKCQCRTRVGENGELTEMKHRQYLMILTSSVLYFLAVLCGLPVSELLSIFFVYKGIFFVV